MNETSLIDVMWTMTWQVTALIGVAWLFARCLGKQHPHVAHAIWLLVLIKCITPPVWSSPSGVFCWVQTQQPSAAIPIEPASQATAIAAPVTSHGPVVSSATVVTPAPVATETASSFSIWFAIWCSGAMMVCSVSVVRCLICWLGIKRRLATPILT